jgi:hypothetical protein
MPFVVCSSAEADAKTGLPTRPRFQKRKIHRKLLSMDLWQFVTDPIVTDPQTQNQIFNGRAAAN